jgi:hypothetical protein
MYEDVNSVYMNLDRIKWRCHMKKCVPSGCIKCGEFLILRMTISFSKTSYLHILTQDDNDVFQVHKVALMKIQVVCDVEPRQLVNNRLLIFTWAIPVCCFNYSDNKHSLTHHCFYLFAHYTVCSSCGSVLHVSARPSHRQVHV